ncbi:DUF86 domain-containing protein [Methanoculleus sp. FWC-SCC1]|uniref:DUF86 domain-containing protein n=1 Tax=Methanoculleus frigidifontis TaxID=2584085 RepID=A0ABT8MCV2_9EURY|nr:DUF86 domain-containing protein [Methanoculleus sp. FWC-SCC1]MDN7025715.1 DUF86 domain-containing protein [Methanoculleus sp. FWC-SCC1]
MKDDRLYLIHILERIERIESYVQGGREEFVASPMRQDAVIRNLEVIGEAAKCISEDLKQRYSDIQWRQIAGLRDVLIHQYMGVDVARVWNIVERDLIPLKIRIRNLLADPGT